MIHIQHEISVFLSQTSDQNIAFDKLIEMVCKIDGIDSGGLYLVNPDNSLNLVAHFGFSKEFLDIVSYYSADSINSTIVNKGKSIYDGNISNLKEYIKIDKIRSTAIIPIQDKGKSIACLNLASHKYDDIPIDTREALESIALNIGGAITRIRSEQALKQSQQNFLSLFNTIEDFLFILNENGNCIEINKTVKTILGYTEEELKNKPVTDFHPPERKQEAIDITNKMLSGEVDYCTIPLICKNGTLIPVDTRVIVGIWNNKKTLFGISRDVTERLKIEDELRISNATKDTFFSIISHDLRGQIGNLIQISDMLAIGDNRISFTNLIDMQRHISKNTYFLLENLLNWAKFNTKKIIQEPKFLILNNIIEKIIEDFRYQSNLKKISIQFKPEKKFRCFADKNMVELIIRNLISNAIKFTPKKGKVSIDIYKEGHMNVFKIKDTGIGIPVEHIDKILSIYEIFATWGTANEKGSGLGLKLCKYFIEMNCGKLYIESQLNKGSTFSFSLPTTTKSSKLLSLGGTE